MKKLISAFAIVILLSMLLSIFVPMTVQASGGIIDSSVTSWDDAVQRHSFYAQGLEWVFYQKSGAWYYKTGNTTGNVTIWSGETALVGICYQDVYYDGSQYAHFAGCSQSPYVGYRRGEPLGNGSILWSTPAPITVMDVGIIPRTVSVSCSSAGYPFISTNYNNEPYSGVGGIIIMRGQANDGNWSDWPEGTPWQTVPGSNAPAFHGNMMLPLLDGKMVCISYDHYYADHLYAELWDGSSTWTSSNSFSPALIDRTFSAITWGDTVRIVYLTTAGDIKADTYYGNTNTWGGGVEIVSGAGATALPSLSGEIGGSLAWMYWPDGNTSISCKEYNSGVWSPAASVVDSEALVLGGNNIFSDSLVPLASHGVYFVTASGDLKYSGSIGVISMPGGYALPPIAKTATTASMYAECTADGGLATSATFYWQGTGMYSPSTLSMGNVTAGEYFSGNLTGLIPATVYWYWVDFTNSSGTYLSNTVYFQTLVSGTPDVPIVQTLAATFVTNSSAQLNGFLAYDGNLDCYLGFQWRKQGDTTWTQNMHGMSGAWPFTSYATYRSPQSYSNTLSGLAIDTTYEYRALAMNGLATTGVYGNITTFTTGHAAGVTPSPGSGLIPPDLVPPGIKTFFDKLGSNLKLIIAVLVTIGAMILVGLKVKAKSASILVVGMGSACVLIFTVLSWYPPYVIILVAGVIALGIFLTLQGRGH